MLEWVRRQDLTYCYVGLGLCSVLVVPCTMRLDGTVGALVIVVDGVSADVFKTIKLTNGGK